MKPYEISGTTRLYCLLGYPARHSASPLIHNTAFRTLSLDCRYLAFEVAPEALPEAVSGLRALGAGGFNLTMPHKNAILPMLDELSESAVLSGSVNTVVNDGGRLIGHTTDGSGYVRSLRAAGFEPSGKRITLLGGGGAAESILVALALEKPAEITVLKRNNQTFLKTEDFARKIKTHTGSSILVRPIEDNDALKDSVTGCDLLINATNVGMAPNEEKSLVPKDLLSPALFVSDIVYHPRETRLLKDAAHAGCKCLGGITMLLHQAADAFHLWTGQEMPLDRIQSDLIRRIEREH